MAEIPGPRRLPPNRHHQADRRVDRERNRTSAGLPVSSRDIVPAGRGLDAQADREIAPRLHRVAAEKPVARDHRHVAEAGRGVLVTETVTVVGGVAAPQERGIGVSATRSLTP